MKALGRGCLELIIIWGAVYYGLSLYLAGKFEPPGDFYGAIAGGFFVACAWGLIRNSFQARQQLGLINSALAGNPPFDGKPYAAIGTARVHGTPLKTPFRKKDCVLYGYELFTQETRVHGRGKDRRTETVKIVYISGYAMTPWSIRTPTMDVRIVGFPIPDEAEEQRFSPVGFEQAILNYNDQTKFTEIKKWEIGKLLGKVKGLFAEGDGDVQEDWRFEDAGPLFNELKAGVQSPNLICMEQHIPPGAPLTVIGCYSAQKGGLIQDLNTGGMQLLIGDAKTGLSTLRKRAISYLIFAVVLAAIGTLGTYGILTLRERGHEIMDKHAKRLAVAVRENDLSKAEVALSRGVSPNVLDGQSRPIILGVRSSEMLQLLQKYGVNLNLQDEANGLTPLIWAIDEDNLTLANLLIDSGADINIEQEGWKRTALETAHDNHFEELARKLAKGRGIYVPALPGYAGTSAQEKEFRAILEGYSTGLNERNVEKVRALVTAWPERFFEGVRNGTYSGTRALTWKVLRSYVKEPAATVVALGDTGEIWIETFLLENGKWKLRREHWDDKRLWE